MYSKIKASFDKLINYCKTEEFKGYDPYDGLTSTFFNYLPLIRNSRLARLIWIQGFKRSPVNFRPLVGIKKEYNPKALGLFLSGYCNLYKLNPDKENLEKIRFFINKIEGEETRGYSGICWGYNFDWESKAFYLPKYTPTIVVSSFIANALLDAYEIISDKKLLVTARSTCDFILKDLNRSYDNHGNFAFSYSRFDNSVVFNASLLGSRLLARVYGFTGESFLIEEAQKSIKYCCDFQKEDGSWSYGNHPFHQWVDNFHSGYNLECISDYIRFSGDHSFDAAVKKGFDYYINTFFTPEGIPGYYNNSVYPVDIHAPSQLVITINKLGLFNIYKGMIDKVLNWTIDNMQSDKGFFYYQINKYFISKIPYMRWSQAWMFYALSSYLSQTGTKYPDGRSNN
jgi:hypothetical protein